MNSFDGKARYCESRIIAYIILQARRFNGRLSRPAEQVLQL